MRKTVIYSLVAVLALVFTGCGKPKTWQSNLGRVFGTYYSLNYKAEANYQWKLDSLFDVINKSMSTFDTLSTVYAINHSDGAVTVDDRFAYVFSVAQYVSEQSCGAFDITVAPLVNLWGFGFDPQDTSTYKSQAQIDSIKEFVGYDKVKITDGKLVKADGRVKLDLSAIAKGYACDVIADFLESQGADDMMVDIGGEIVTRGYNPMGELWRIGIVSPVDDTLQTNNDVEHIVEMDNKAIATSGNYRQFYITKERKVTHTIDPVSGYPVNGNVLSASVIAPNCTVADAYATTFMVVGDTTRIKDIIKASKYNLEAYVIVDSAGVHVGKWFR
ncbi:MAG: FAD:protein FMN transferase [Paludibacteraceae bacterium]|nr:FAD:protein FMN transferase [Paludibacteraceae bacterium]